MLTFTFSEAGNCDVNGAEDDGEDKRNTDNDSGSNDNDDTVNGGGSTDDDLPVHARRRPLKATVQMPQEHRTCRMKVKTARVQMKTVPVNTTVIRLLHTVTVM